MMKINVTKSYIRELRGMLYILEQYGLEDLNQHLYKRQDFQIRRNQHTLSYHHRKGHALHVIRGKLSYLKMVKGGDDKVYMGLFQKFKGIVDSHPNYQETLKRSMYLKSLFT